MKVRTQFSNMRYLVKGNLINFWSQEMGSKRCHAKLLEKSNDYLLLKIISFDHCFAQVSFLPGSFLNFYSEDLIKNIDRAKEVMGILLKKRMALEAKKHRLENELESFQDKVETIRSRYNILREKLERESQKDLGNLDSKKSSFQKELQATIDRLNKVDHKLQQYQVKDKNLELDRWSLDSRYYFEK